MPAIKITRYQLIAMKPCDLDDRLKLFGPRRETLSAAQAFKAGVSISDLLWVAGRLGLRDQSVAFALACARRVAHLDKTGSAQRCIDATTAYWGDKSETNLKALREARRSAAADAADADAAAYAAAAAAAAAAYAAYAAAAAYAAYAAAAYSNARRKEVEAQQALFLEIFNQ